MTELILPNGQPASTYDDLAKADEGKGKITGLTPWKQRAINGRGIEGAATKSGRWHDYYDMYRQHSFVRAAIDKIAKTATNAGFDFVPRDSRAKIKKSEVKTLQDFFVNQNNFISELQLLYTHLLIYGDAYLYIVPDRRRRPIKLKVLPPQTMHIAARKNGEIIAYYQKDPDDVTDDVVKFEPHEILHFRIPDPGNSLYGLSPLESLKWAVAADLYAQRYNAAFFQNSGVSGTIIGIRNANPAEVQRNRKWLEENYIGPEAAHKPIIFEGESISISKSVATHQEMGFLEGRRFIILEILAVLDVPPAKIGIMESANRSNSKEQDKTFRTESISPLQRMVQDVINDSFVRDVLGVGNTIFVHSEGDTRDAIEQMDYYTKGQAWGNFNVNEIRAKLGMAPVEGGDINGIMTPTGFVPLDRLHLFFQLPRINTDKVPPVAEDPPSGEPVPRATPQVATAVSREVAKSALPPALSLHGALLKLAEAPNSDAALRQAYSYLNDLLETGDTRIVNAHQALSKAVRCTDGILKMGYIERASEALGHVVQPDMADVIDVRKQLEQQYADEDAEFYVEED